MKLSSELDGIQLILETPYEDNSVQIFSHIAKLSGLVGRLNKLKSEAEYYLTKARFLALEEIDRCYSKSEFKIPSYRKEAHLDNIVSEEELAYNLISGMCRAIEIKITAGQSLLRSITQDKGYGQI